VAKKNSGTKVGGKGHPTPKRNAGKNNQKAQQSLSAKRQWYLIIAIAVVVIAVIFVLASIFGEPYNPNTGDIYSDIR